MPLCTVHLLSLRPGLSPDDFLLSLLASPLGPSLKAAAHVRGSIIRATTLDSTFLSSNRWDLVIILGPGAEGLGEGLERLPTEVRCQVQAEYAVTGGVPSRIYDTYEARSKDLNRRPRPALICDVSPMSPAPSNGRGLEATTSMQNLEVAPDLLRFKDWLTDHEGHDGPVSMLNLLHFWPGKEAKDSYYQYGQAFASIASRRGGNAKLVGNVVAPSTGRHASPRSSSDSRGPASRPAETWWNELSYVHYPTIAHFCDMAADDEYQRANRQYRLKALRDTVLMCTTEYDLETMRRRAGEQRRSKL